MNKPNSNQGREGRETVMSETKFTPGPWRWEFSEKYKGLQLVGGRPCFDLIVMDFVRRGMGSAIARFRDSNFDGLCLMHRVCDRKDWIAPIPGREHHAHWCANVIHPDAALIAEAPAMYAALEAALFYVARSKHETELGEMKRDKDLAEFKAILARARGEGKS